MQERNIWIEKNEEIGWFNDLEIIHIVMDFGCIFGLTCYSVVHSISTLSLFREHRQFGFDARINIIRF